MQTHKSNDGHISGVYRITIRHGHFPVFKAFITDNNTDWIRQHPTDLLTKHVKVR